MVRKRFYHFVEEQSRLNVHFSRVLSSDEFVFGSVWTLDRHPECLGSNGIAQGSVWCVFQLKDANAEYQLSLEVNIVGGIATRTYKRMYFITTARKHSTKGQRIINQLQMHEDSAVA